jgi:hypothetical protein
MHRTTLTLALVAITLLSGCATSVDSAPATETAELTSTEPTATPPGNGSSPDQPPADFDGADNTLGPNERPHVVRLVNDGNETRNITLNVSRDRTPVFEQEFRSFPNTTILGELDHIGNYTLTVSVVGTDRTVTETLPAAAFDCNVSTTIFDLSEVDPTVTTITTEMACGNSGTSTSDA